MRSSGVSAIRYVLPSSSTALFARLRRDRLERPSESWYSSMLGASGRKGQYSPVATPRAHRASRACPRRKRSVMDSSRRSLSSAMSQDRSSRNVRKIAAETSRSAPRAASRSR